MNRTVIWLGVGTVLGFLGGTWASRPAPEELPVRSQAPRATVSNPSPSARPSAPVSGSCADDLALASQTIADLELELYGSPVAWTDDVSPDHRPEAVQARVKQAFEDCGLTADLVGFDCDEAPCYAIVDNTGQTDAYAGLLSCPTWTDTWGTGVGLTNSSVECAGVTHRLLMISPGTERANEDRLAARPERTPEERAEARVKMENETKRHRVRSAAAEERLCARAAR